MEIFVLGISTGIIIGTFLIGFFMVTINKDKEKEEPNYNTSWLYEKGSAEEKEELECLIASLYVINIGLSRHEKQIMAKTIGYLEREIND